MKDEASRAKTSEAIAVLTAWTIGEGAMAYETAHELFPETSAADLATGLLNVAAYLLMLREKETGTTPRETLQYVASII